MAKRLWKFPSLNLKKKAFIIFLLFVILPTLGVGVLVQQQFNRILTQQYIDSTARSLDSVVQTMSEMITNVENISDYMIYSPDMRAFLQTPNIESNRNQIAVHSRNIAAYVTFQLISKGYIKSITIESLNGNRLEMGESVRGDESAWVDKAFQSAGSIVWSEAYPIKGYGSEDIRVISLYRVINDINLINIPLGRITVRLDEDEFSRTLQRAVPVEEGRVFIIDADGKVITHPDEALTGKTYPDSRLMELLEQRSNRSFTYSDSNSNYLVLSKNLSATQWRVVVQVPEKVLAESASSVKMTMQAILWTILIFGILGLIGFHYTIIRPVIALNKETHRVKKGDFTARVNVITQDEIGELGRQFNNMVATIKELIDYKYKLEIRQRDSELKLLQQQMDPHFLYNTLDMIRWTARLEKASRTSQLIEKLSKFFRLSLSEGQLHTTLKQELELVQSYLYLHQQRLGDKLSFSLYTEADIADASILKYSIQPLVENSLKHGKIGESGEGRLNVICYRQGKEIWIDVMDNGVGFDGGRIEDLNEALVQSQEEEPHELHGHAIFNIHERFSIAYGEDYGIEILSLQEHGAFVRLKLPYIRYTGR